jgi:uncharacterized protein YjbI with pentapeptide repeats
MTKAIDRSSIYVFTDRATMKSVVTHCKCPNMPDLNRNVYRGIEAFAKSIDSYHQLLRLSSGEDLPKHWEKNQLALIKLQQLIRLEIERVRLIVTQSPEDRGLQNCRDWHDLNSMDFQDCQFFDFSVKGIRDCSNFEFADLSNANLSGTRTNRTIFSYAKLICADLSDVYWRNVQLTGADLSGANLQGARFSYDLNSVNLSDTNLCNADLSSADLIGINWSNANVTNTKFGRNQGIYPSLEQDLVARGAIFDRS